MSRKGVRLFFTGSWCRLLPACDLRLYFLDGCKCAFNRALSYPVLFYPFTILYENFFLILEKNIKKYDILITEPKIFLLRARLFLRNNRTAN